MFKYVFQCFIPVLMLRGVGWGAVYDIYDMHLLPCAAGDPKKVSRMKVSDGIRWYDYPVILGLF